MPGRKKNSTWRISGWTGSLWSQYAALHDELVSLVKKRDEIILENRRNQQSLEEEKNRLWEVNRYIKKKVHAVSHELQKIQEFEF